MDSYKTIETKLQERLPFTGNSLKGYWYDDEYLVISYNTLIAKISPAVSGGRWVNPNKYSQTTSRQQNLIKRAWGILN